MLDISSYRENLSNLCAIYGVKRLELFGSASQGNLTAESDLDFLVEFANTHHAMSVFDRYFGLKEALEHLFQRQVDLVEVEAIKNPYFQQAIEEDRVLIYGA